MNIKDLKNPTNWSYDGLKTIDTVFKHPTPSIAIFVVSILSIFFLWVAMKHTQNRKRFDIKITESKAKSTEIVNYTIPYMISFVAFDIGNKHDLAVMVLFVSMLCVLTIRNQSILINPILAVFGYSLYECKYTERGLQKETNILSKDDPLSGTDFKITKLTNFLAIGELHEE